MGDPDLDQFLRKVDDVNSAIKSLVDNDDGAMTNADNLILKGNKTENLAFNSSRVNKYGTDDEAGVYYLTKFILCFIY